MVQYLETIGLIDKNGNKPILKVANNGNRVGHQVDNSIKIKNKRSKTSISEIGCFASHRELWLEQLSNQWESVLILEDDARFEIPKTLNLVKHWNLLPDFDFLHLGWEYFKNPIPHTIEKVEIQSLPDLWKGDGMWFTHAYVMKLSGAIGFEKRSRVQYGGLDWQTSGIQTHLNCYGFRPGICNQLKKSFSNKSTIRHTQ